MHEYEFMTYSCYRSWSASHTPCPRAIRLEWSFEMDDNLNFVSTQIRLHNLL